jgi:hypothetical protein
VHGWSVSERDVALSQMELVHGCESSDPACMVLIAGTLGAQRIVYGTISRSPMGSRYEFAISIFSFDVASGEVDQRAQRNLSSSRTDIDQLREPAREIIAQIANTPRFGTIRVSAAAGREVRIDGTVVGTTDAGGSFVASDIATGSHEVLVQGAPSQSVTVAEGTEQLVDVTTLAPVEGGGGGGGGPEVNWLAVALLAGAGVAMVGSIYTWGRLLALANDGQYTDYRNSLRGRGLPADSACTEAAFAMGGEGGTYARGVCDEAGTLEILQYVFLGVAVAAGATGIVLLVLDSTSGGDDHEDQTVTLVPQASPYGGGFQLQTTF